MNLPDKKRETLTVIITEMILKRIFIKPVKKLFKKYKANLKAKLNKEYLIKSNRVKLQSIIFSIIVNSTVSISIIVF